MKTGIIRFTPEHLVQYIGLAAGTQILGVRQDPFCGGTVEFVIQHDSLPENCEGCIPPLVQVDQDGSYYV